MLHKTIQKRGGHHSSGQLPMSLGTATVGERGQVVIPADVREQVGLKKGDKLVVFSPRAGILSMVHASAFRSFLSQIGRHLGKM